jgi:4-hydroxy-tetrahydrodipicolinate synthase
MKNTSLTARLNRTLRSKLGGTLPVIPTPFFRGGIDYDSLLRLFDHIFPELDGCTLGGSTGEGVSLSLQERLQLMKFAVRHAPAGKHIVVGLTHTNLEESKVLARAAAKLGCYAGLIPAPYYFPSHVGMVREFLVALDEASDLNLVFYDNPIYTKAWLSADEICSISKACKHLASLKLTDHDLDKISIVKKNGISVFAGDDVTAFRSLLLGAEGSMIIAPAIFPLAYQQTVALLATGDKAEALRYYSAHVLPFIHLFGPGDEIAVTKSLYHHLGIFRSGELRLPLLPATKERLDEALLAYELCLDHIDRTRRE